MEKENDIIRSWSKNASEWSRLIEQEKIASRKFTNPAIVEEVMKYDLLKILDLGCGEGWLSRALKNKRNSVTGVDVTEALLETARRKSSQNFYRMSYEEIIEGKSIPEAPFDAVVLNFCLYHKEEVPRLLFSLRSSLSKPGLIFIQTLHPVFLLLNNQAYEDQWIKDSWKGLQGNFVEPHAWYARTFESWISAFIDSGFNILGVKEVTNDSKIPVSVIFKAEKVCNSKEPDFKYKSGRL